MYHIRLGFDLFKKNLILNLFISGLIAISLIIINISLGIQNSQNMVKRMMEPFAKENGGCFMAEIKWPVEITDETLADMESAKAEEVFSQLKSLREFITIPRFSLHLSGKERINGKGYTRFMLEKMKIPLAKGKWPEKGMTEDGVLPVVIFSETQSLAYGDEKTVTLDISVAGTSVAKDPKEIKIKVVGVFPDVAYIPELGLLSNSAIPNESVFTLYDKNYESFFELPTVFFTIDNSSGFLTDFYSSEPTNGFVIFDETASESDINKDIKIMRESGVYFTFQDMAKASEEENSIQGKTFSFFLIMSLVISLLGLFSVSVINSYKHLRYFSTLYLFGCNKKRSLMILSGYYLCVAIVSALLLSLVLLYMNFTRTAYRLGAMLAGNNIFITALVYLGLLVFFLAAPISILGKNPPVKVLKENER